MGDFLDLGSFEQATFVSFVPLGTKTSNQFNLQSYPKGGSAIASASLSSFSGNPDVAALDSATVKLANQDLPIPWGEGPAAYHQGREARRHTAPILVPGNSVNTRDGCRTRHKRGTDRTRPVPRRVLMLPPFCTLYVTLKARACSTGPNLK